MALSPTRVVTKTFDYDGGREVTAYIPSRPADLIVFAADGGWHAAKLAAALEAANAPPTLIVGVHGMPDDQGRLKEYVEKFDPLRFAAHESFFTGDIYNWARSTFAITLQPTRTAVWGASLGAELALALSLRRPDQYGIVLAASPGAGYRPPTPLPSNLPRTYLVAGAEEQFFLQNATRWADALRDAKADIVMQERPGTHGGAFWYEEFPRMVRWALGR